jgi:hypothetical protein
MNLTFDEYSSFNKFDKFNKFSSDKIGRVVSSHGSSLSTWQVQLLPTPKLVREGTATIASGQDGGFFAAISTNGTRACTGVGMRARAKPSLQLS